MKTPHLSAYGLIFIFIFTLPVFGQTIRYQTIDKASSVNCSMEDSKGNPSGLVLVMKEFTGTIHPTKKKVSSISL